MIPIFPYSIPISPSSIRLDSFAYATYTNPILRSFRLEIHASATRLSARRRLRSALARRYTLPLIRRACRPFLLITTILLLTSNVSAQTAGNPNHAILLLLLLVFVFVLVRTNLFIV